MQNENIKSNNASAMVRNVMIVLCIALGLFVPLHMIENQIANRRSYESIAQESVANAWGKDVGFGTAKIITDKGVIYPLLTDTVIEIESQEKRKGLFNVPVYLAKLNTKINFADKIKAYLAQSKIGKMDDSDVVFIHVKPLSAIQSFKVKDSISGKDLEAKLSNEGIVLPISRLVNSGDTVKQISVDVSIRGTGQILLESFSDQDKVKIIGNWKKPKFTENILPSYATVKPDGFEAEWTLNNLEKIGYRARESRLIGLELLWVGADYVKTERALKYGVLYIVLIFLLIFIIESLGKIRIHPLQYSLIGLSICIFYLLLLALSEGFGFDVAYLISAISVAGLIVYYVKGFVFKAKLINMILIEQVVLSSFFYIILSLEESSFLVGSIGLFVVLCVFMSITRRFDWFAGKTINSDIRELNT